MFSFFKKQSETVGMNVSPWLLDEASGEIKKDMIVYRDGKVNKRIQVVYAVHDMSGTEFDMRNLLPGLPSSVSKTQHLSILHSPCLGLGDGYMAAMLGTILEDNEGFRMVDPITTVIEISDNPNKGFTLIHFKERMDVIKAANLMGKGNDVGFELYGNPDRTLYLRFPISNEPGFGQLREALLR